MPDLPRSDSEYWPAYVELQKRACSLERRIAQWEGDKIESDAKNGHLEQELATVNAKLKEANDGLIEYAREIVALEGVKEANEKAAREFPMLDGPRIPWSLAEKLYAGYSAEYGTTQSLERLAERGGFGWAEIAMWWKKSPFRAAIRALPDTGTQAKSEV